MGSSGDDKKNLKPKTKGKRSWWQRSTDPPDPPPTPGAESGADTEKVLEGTPDDHLQLQHNDKNPDPGAARAQEQLANLTSKLTAIETSQQEIKNFQQKLAEKSAQGITNIELEARLTKLLDFIKVNNFDRLWEIIDKDIKSVEEETDRLLGVREKRLEVKITNLEQRMKKHSTDLETKLGSRIINSSTQMQTVAEKIQDQFDSLKREEDTALVEDLEHKIEKQVQTSLTKTNVDIRSLEHKVTENINNITNLQTKVQGTEKEKISKFELAEQTDNTNTLLEMKALNQNLVKDMASVNQKVVNLQKNMSKQAGLPNRVTSLEQKYHNLSSHLGRMKELTDKIIRLEQLVEEIRDETNNDFPLCKICNTNPCTRTFRCREHFG